MTEENRLYTAQSRTMQTQQPNHGHGYRVGQTQDEYSDEHASDTVPELHTEVQRADAREISVAAVDGATKFTGTKTTRTIAAVRAGQNPKLDYVAANGGSRRSAPINSR